MKKNVMLYTFLTVFIVIADQITKFVVVKKFSETTCITAIPHLFDFVYVENTGAAFSILTGKTFALGIVSVLFCIALFVYWLILKPKSRFMNISLSLLMGGAIGNAADRLIRGSVVDFIHTSFMEFPVFNVADMAITFGAVFLMIYFVFLDKDEQKDGKNNLNGN